MILRPYQQEARDAILREWAEGRKRTLLVLPTGCGKTVCFASVVKEQVDRGGRALIMAHRGELLDQAAEKVKLVSGLECAYEKAGYSSLGSWFPVTVGSVQSLCQTRRLQQFPSDYFSTIVVDEAHHCLSDSYQRVLEHFADVNVLGVSATPDRTDKRNLGRFFDSCAYEYTMTQAIRQHYLCPVKAQMIPLKLDISEVSVTNGDYSAGDIGVALEPYLRQIAREIVENYAERKTVVFLPLVHTSQQFCEILNDMGLSAAEVNGNSADRADILRDFEAGRYSVLCNSMLLTEGWDCPAVDCIVVLRPTKSRSLYQQMVGRGMRLFPGKEELILLDFLWMSARHDLCRPSALISKDAEIAAKIDKQVEDAPFGVDIMEAEEEAERDVLREREQALARQLAEMRNRKRKLVDPLQYAMSIAAEDLANYVPEFAWEMGPPTKKQLQFLENRGIFAESVENMGKAHLLIDRLVRRQQEGLSTPKQIRCLERYGFRQVGTWTFDQASAMISRLAANNWRIPFGFNVSAYRPQ
ncbi:MAG: DEAD/DEAH box helicase [Clostridia bacterium]|nr:DEAD/DEAH box helicase [Clostridia bacterium]